jgi:repressor LexA
VVTSTRRGERARLAILDAIRASLDERGYPPTIRELCDAVGLGSTDTVAFHLKRLEADGYIRRITGSPRAIALTTPEDADA